MIENRAVGTIGDIHRRKHASQRKSENKLCFILFFLFFYSFYFFIFLGKINKNILGRQGNEGRLGYANQTPFF